MLPTKANGFLRDLNFRYLFKLFFLFPIFKNKYHIHPFQLHI